MKSAEDVTSEAHQALFDALCETIKSAGTTEAETIGAVCSLAALWCITQPKPVKAVSSCADAIRREVMGILATRSADERTGEASLDAAACVALTSAPGAGRGDA